MRDERPRIDVPPRDFDRLLLGLAWAGLIAIVAMVALAYPSLPERVPMHLDSQGQPTAWGPKWTILLLPAIGIVTAGVALAVLKVPPYSPLINYPVRITPQNAEAIYGLTKRMMRAMAAVTAWTFLVVTGSFIMVAHGRGGPGVWLLPFIAVPILITLAVFIALIFRAAHTAKSTPTPD